jgi:hypothetical protein
MGVGDGLPATLKEMANWETDFPCVCDVHVLDAAKEIEHLRRLLVLFDNHFICEYCDSMAATYLTDCENPLHGIHDHLYDSEWYR